MKKPKPLTIKDKPATVAANWRGHNVRAETEGGDEGGDAGELVAARDVRFTGVMIDSKQFDQLVGEQAYNSFFNQNGDMHEPAFKSFSKLRLDGAYTNCEAKITFGLSDKSIELDSTKIKNITVKPWVGGMAELAFTMVAVFPHDLSTLEFERYSGKQVGLSVTFGPIDHVADKQEQLPLDSQPAVGTPIDKTRIVNRNQQQKEAETERQLGEALRGLEKNKTKNKSSKAATAGAH